MNVIDRLPFLVQDAEDGSSAFDASKSVASVLSPML